MNRVQLVTLLAGAAFTLGLRSATAQIPDLARQGATLRVQFDTGTGTREILGILLRNSGSSLRLAAAGSADTLSLAVEQLRRLDVSRERSDFGGRGALIGAGLGIVLGVVGGATAQNDQDAAIIAGSIVYGGLGAVLGLVMGNQMPRERWTTAWIARPTGTISDAAPVKRAAAFRIARIEFGSVP